ncbi:hypothetical protein MAR_027176 [Mya arenaria]|uniref:Myb/SANT-like DNA-binding domain-containing protein n=1 Tax=Mya arenaria TaxID=6604 RepID=A0ABY7EWB2_MYAAR|nr:hypothetical protein MAR_027176 [Mya arenaria]
MGITEAHPGSSDIDWAIAEGHPTGRCREIPLVIAIMVDETTDVSVINEMFVNIRIPFSVCNTQVETLRAAISDLCQPVTGPDVKHPWGCCIGGSEKWSNSSTTTSSIIERHAALSTILNQHDSLFGKFKGATLGIKAKEAKWDEIVMEINSCGGTSRTVEEVRKMYQNSKQRAKEKFFRSQKTGGGPRDQFSACDNLLLDKLKDTNVLTGIAGGIMTTLNLELVHVAGRMKTLHMKFHVYLQRKCRGNAFEGHNIGSFTARKQSSEVDELYELEKKRARVEQQLAENRNVLKELKLLEMKDVRWMWQEKATTMLMKFLSSVFTSLEREAGKQNDEH